MEVNEKIATTQRAIATAAEHPAAEASFRCEPGVAAVAAAGGELQRRVERAGRPTGAQLEAELREAQTRLKELEEATGPNDELQRRLAQTQADYTLYAQKRDEARISGELDKEKMFDVSLVQAPVASPRPDRPKPMLYLAAGAGVGAAAGYAAGAVCGYFRGAGVYAVAAGCA